MDREPADNSNDGLGQQSQRLAEGSTDGSAEMGVDLGSAAVAMCAAACARPYQREIAAECMKHLRASRKVGIAPVSGRRSRSVLIQAPTGSGKTLMGLICGAVLQNVLGLRVGWCAGRQELLRQAARENAKFDLGVELVMISMFDRRPPNVDVLIIDEAHHDGAMSMATLHGVIDPSIVLGLTATPYRRDRVKLCFEKVIRSCSIQRLVDDGYLSRYRHFTIPCWAPTEVAAGYSRDRAKWGQSLIFFHTKAAASECLEALRAHRVKAELVTGTSDRDTQIKAFESGEVEVLLSMNILTEGFDCPSLRTVFCRPSSRATTVQMGGRVFRLHDGTPMKQIVQMRGTPMPFTRIVRPEEQHLLIDGQWRSLGATRELDGEIEAQRQRLADVKVDLPRFLTHGRGRPRTQRRRAAAADQVVRQALE